MRACAERARAVDDGVVASEDIPGRFEEEEREAGAGGGGMRGGGWLVGVGRLDGGVENEWVDGGLKGWVDGEN